MSENRRGGIFLTHTVHIVVSLDHTRSCLYICYWCWHWCYL